MATQDQTRIARDRARPRITELWWALRPLTSIIRFMQTGAHPDDEISGMLAALAFRDGINISYACSTRGEGGQNDVGTQAGPALGALRTREMEAACDILRMRMYWHSEAPTDPITDFGFSKSGEETLGRWGAARTLARFVEIIRTEKPDIICPTFLDVPGQHGHHRAMTQAAHAVMAAAADPAFASNLIPWQVRKMYLPAWSGAGQAYDDDLPPPPATMTISGAGADPVSGWDWERIGQQSRAYHRTQGMGRWVPAGQRRDWPLHLAESHVDGPDDALSAGLVGTVGGLASLPGATPIEADLRTAQDEIETCLAAFPDFERVAKHACAALSAIRAARAGCPADLAEEVQHRLSAKEVQLGHVIRLALGISAEFTARDLFLHPGQQTTVSIEIGDGAADTIETSFDLPSGWEIIDGTLRIGADAAPTDPYRPFYDPEAAAAPACVLTIHWADERITVREPMDAAPVILPAPVASLTPDAHLINLASGARHYAGRISDAFPLDAVPRLEVPEGWEPARIDAGDISLNAPETLAEGSYTLPLTLDGVPAKTVERITQPHTTPTALAAPARLRVVALRAELPSVRIGYIGAGNDRVQHWLAALGADVTELPDAMLASDAELAGFDTIIIGIFAIRFRAGLLQAMPRLHRWTEAGGTLLTLYHRPWDNWDPETVPPRPLEIGQPSLRWRVTDEGAEVRHLADHPLLSTPNLIGPEDWQGWVKERGLYFAKSWDDAYTPLVEMADPGEAAHQGILLVADIGAGRHIHTSLILHHQMENLVPGAFRIMANLVAKRG